MTHPSNAASAERKTGRAQLSAVTGLAALGGLLFGYDTGVISGGLLFVKEEFGLSPLGEGLVVSSLLVGAALSAATGGRLADRYGRRPLLIGAALVFAVGAVLAALAPGTTVLVLARFVLGLGVGAASTIVPLYIAELAPPRIRGALVTTNQLMITIGILISYFVGYALSGLEAWRWMFGLALLPAVALGIGMLFLPDTPRFLVKQGRRDDALAVLSRIRGTDAREELDEIATTLEQERARTGRLRDLAERGIRPLLVIGVGISIFSQIAGINTIIYFAPTVLVSAGMGASSSILAQVGIGAVNVLMTIVAILLVDRLGRRPLVITAFAGMSASMAILGLVYLMPEGGLTTPLLIVCMALYIMFFAFGLGTTVWLVMSEVFPLRIRGAAVGVATMAQWAANFVVSLLFPTLLATLGDALTFWLFGVICLAALWFVTAKVPETKGKTLEQIEAQLQAGDAR